MKEFKINVYEKLEYSHSYIIKLPDNVNDENVWEAIEDCVHHTQIPNVVDNYNGEIIASLEDGSGDGKLMVDCVDEIKEQIKNTI